MHQKVAEAYNAAGYEYILRSEDRVATYFEAITADQPRKKHCDALVRVKSGGYGETKEFLVWHQTTTSNDEYGNKKTFTAPIGVCEVPQFEYQYDQISKRRKVTGISDFEKHYDTYIQNL